MNGTISRRALLSSGIKTSIGLVFLQDLPLTAAPIVAAVQDTRANDFQPAFQCLDQFIARHMKDFGAPGMTVALADRKGLLHASQYGLADLKAGSPVKPDTLFEIGSISKSFVAIAALQISEEGNLDLNKPAKDTLPPHTTHSPSPPHPPRLTTATRSTPVAGTPSAAG